MMTNFRTNLFRKLKIFCFRKSLTMLLLFLVLTVSIAIISKQKQNVKFSESPHLGREPKFEETIVHFDFKGAAPKITYLLDLIPLIKKFGATGILLEYEDVFPYHHELENIKAFNSYSISNISAIIKAAEENNLTIIPLIQTFGHLEFLLKLEQYKHFREVNNNPQVLCPSHDYVYLVLKEMIDQVLSIHSSAKYFHIGCDEVNFIGICSKCQSIMKRNKWRKEDIYFNHIRKVARYISSAYPKVRPLVWGDKILRQNERIILKMDIPDLVDVMFWNYKTETHNYPHTEDMKSYERLLRHIWVAGAFKGATGVGQLVPNPEYHLRNTEGWIKIASNWKTKINFRGIVLTGWQRYNHFTVLCELLPVAIPSLALNLQVLRNSSGSNYNEWKEILKCNDFPPINLKGIKDAEKISKLQCDFPGYNIYREVHSFFYKLHAYKLLWNYFQNNGFFFYNIVNNISNPLYVQELLDKGFEGYLIEINNLEIKLRNVLSTVYNEDVVNEWITTQVVPTQMRFRAAVQILRKLSEKNVWPRRPLKTFNLKFQNFFNESKKTKLLVKCYVIHSYYG